MKHIPILFSTPMVQSILKDIKDRTRRTTKLDLVNEDPDNWKFNRLCVVKERLGAEFSNGTECIWIPCPYGKPDDLLWVRETWRPKGHNFPIGSPFEYKATAETDGVPMDEPWKPAIHMPKEAARIWLQVSNIRVERLSDITEQEIIKEGVRIPVNGIGTNKVLFELGKVNSALSFLPDLNTGEKYSQSQLLKAFWAELWCKINGRENWDLNPWLWVVEFKQIELCYKTNEPCKYGCKGLCKESV